MVLGLRYPKGWVGGQSDVPPAGVDAWRHITTTTIGNPYSGMIGSSPILLAPNRYSEVRKVVFWAVVKKDSEGTHSTYPVRLRVAPIPETPGDQSPEIVTLSPGTAYRLFGASGLLNGAFDNTDLYSEVGSATITNLPVGLGDLDTPGHLVTIEFDRFAPAATDFFNDWDSATALDDEYIAYRLVFERTDGSNFTSNTSAELQIHSYGVEVVQAPATVNNTCTYVPCSIAYHAGQAAATYSSNVNRAWFFRWHPDDWDNIESVHICMEHFGTSANVRNIDFALHELTGLTPEVRTQVGVAQNFTDGVGTRSSGDLNFWRSTDILSELQSGGEGIYQIAHDEQASVSITPPIVWLEIIQKGYTKTVCYHSAGTCMRTDLNTTEYGAPGCGFFDPTWYQGFPDDRILKRRIFAAMRHLAGAIEDEVSLYLDSDFESDHTQLTTSSATAVKIQPSLTSTPDLDTGIKNRDATITPGPDPLELIGSRKLIWGLDNVVAAATGNPGDMGVYYALDVPNSEFLEIGDLFEVGAFNPEGCASTSAGLGDPGKLYISNGSVRPKMFDPEEGAIQNAGICTPFPDEVPTHIVTDTASSPLGGLPDGTYTYRYTLRNCCTGKESDPNPEDIVVTVSGASPAGKVTFSFAGVRIPSDPQVCEICLYRTINGGDYPIMAKVGCFDPDVTTTFEDDLADSELDFTNEQLSTLNAPMPCVPYIVEFRNRIFGAGDIPVLNPAGTVSVEQGSDIVTGSNDVEWDCCLEGKYIQIGSDCRKYEIDRVLPPVTGVSPPIGRLRLIDEYEGPNNTGQTYTICGHPNRLYYSEPLEGGCWPVVNFIDIEPGDGDRIMGLSSNFDRLVIYKRRKTYVMTFNLIPALEVVVPARISSDIGGIAPRSYAQIENGTVGLSDRGLALFDGRGIRHVPESDQANAIFVDPNNDRYVRRDDLGRVIDAVGVYYPKREQYLLLLPTVQTTRGSNLMLVWDTSLRNITLLEFCQEFQAMVVGKDSEGNQIVYLGDTNGFVWAFDIGHSDGVGNPGATGTVRGTVTSSGVDSLGASFISDSSASFIEGGVPELAGLSGVAGLSGSLDGGDLGLAGACVHYRAPGATVWQSRFIYAASSQKLYVTPSLAGDDDLTGYEYMIGAIRFEAAFKPSNYGDDDYTKRNWKQIITHEIEEFASALKIELRADFGVEDQFEGDILNDDGTEGRLFTMDWKTGKQVRQVEKVVHTYLQTVMTNFAPEEPIRVFNHLLTTTPRESRH